MRIRALIMIVLMAGSFLIGCGKEKKEKITEKTLKKITTKNVEKKADNLIKELDNM